MRFANKWLCWYLTVVFWFPAQGQDCVPGVHLSTWKGLYPRTNKYIREIIMNPIEESLTEEYAEVINSIQPDATNQVNFPTTHLLA